MQFIVPPFFSLPHRLTHLHSEDHLGHQATSPNSPPSRVCVWEGVAQWYNQAQDYRFDLQHYKNNENLFLKPSFKHSSSTSYLCLF
jgi:hypothetical protein